MQRLGGVLEDLKRRGGSDNQDRITVRGHIALFLIQYKTFKEHAIKTIVPSVARKTRLFAL